MGLQRATARPFGHRNRSLRIGAMVIVLVAGGSAAARSIIRNYGKADVVRSAPCLLGFSGSDAIAYPTGVPSISLSSDSSGSSEGVPLGRQILTVRGIKPERTVIADAYRIRNRCNRPLSVTLNAVPHNTDPAVGGQWADLSMRVYVSVTTTAAPASDASPPNSPTALIARGNSFGDATVSVMWDQTPIKVAAVVTGPGTVLTATTGVITLPANRDAQVGLVVDGGSVAQASDAILRLAVRAVG